jgi:hypothetical protein
MLLHSSWPDEGLIWSSSTIGPLGKIYWENRGGFHLSYHFKTINWVFYIIKNLVIFVITCYNTNFYHFNIPGMVQGGAQLCTALSPPWIQKKTLRIINHSEINTGWWFGTFGLFIHSVGNNHPNWLSYFSEVLKPPTRILIR